MMEKQFKSLINLQAILKQNRKKIKNGNNIFGILLKYFPLIKEYMS